MEKQRNQNQEQQESRANAYQGYQKSANFELAEIDPPAFQLRSLVPIQMMGKEVVQRVEKETHFGKYKAIKYDKSSNNKKLHAALKFEPNDKVDATKIGFTQSIHAYKEGVDVAIDPNAKTRMVEEGDAKGQRIDRLSNKNTPIYGSASLGEDKGLKDTKSDNNRSSDPTELNPDEGRNATYELGYHYKDGEEIKKKEAGMYDGPTIYNKKNSAKIFESTALALDGSQKGTYYGSVKWGYKTNDEGEFEKIPFELLSQGVPTNNFMAAAKKWNDATVRGLYVAAKDNVEVLKQDNPGEELGKLKENDEVDQKGTYGIGGVSYILADIKSGDHKDKTGFIKVADLKDKGDGADTVDLPTMTVKVTTKKTKMYPSLPSLVDKKTFTELPAKTRMRRKGWMNWLGYKYMEVVDGEHITSKGYVSTDDYKEEGK